MIAINDSVQEIILDDDKNLNPTEQTVFQVRPLSAKSYSIVSDLMKVESNEDGKTNISGSGKYTFNTLLYGLVGWSNFKDVNGLEVKFDTKNMEKNISRLPISARYELSTKILEISMMTPIEQGN